MFSSYKEAFPHFGGFGGELPEHSGRSVLSFAVEAGSVDVVQSLLAAGADPNAREPSGRRTAAHYIRLRDCLHVPSASDPSAPAFFDSSFFTRLSPLPACPLSAEEADIATNPPCNARVLAVIAALQSAGADLMLSDAQGHTPLARVVALEGLQYKDALSRHLKCAVRPAEAVVRALLAAGGGSLDSFAAACAAGHFFLARLVLHAVTPQPSLRLVLDHARSRVHSVPKPNSFGGFPEPNSFGGFGYGAAPATAAPAAASATAAAANVGFTQADLLLCCSLNHTEGIRELLAPGAAAPPLSIDGAGSDAAADMPLLRAVAHDCAEAMGLLLVRHLQLSSGTFAPPRPLPSAYFFNSPLPSPSPSSHSFILAEYGGSLPGDCPQGCPFSKIHGLPGRLCCAPWL
jgi:hypothetical protein